MIHREVPGDVEIVPTGHRPIQPGRQPRRYQRYAELMGGLGDVLLRVFNHDCYTVMDKLWPGERGAVVLMCHNPYAADLFRWHPKADLLDVYDLGFKTPFHPWAHEGWRLAHGLPRTSPCPGPSAGARITWYPGPDDLKALAELDKIGPYVAFTGIAGRPDRDIPPSLREHLATLALRAGLKVVLVGRSHYFRPGRAFDVAPRAGVIDMIDRLSVPGTALAVEKSAGTICTHSSVCLLSWGVERPVCLLYPQEVYNRVVRLGPGGYMFGMNRPTTYHAIFEKVEEAAVRSWLQALRPAATF